MARILEFSHALSQRSNAASPNLTLSTTFQLRMVDASMLEAGIGRGDIVSFQRSQTFSSGDLVAVHTPDGIFIKFIYPMTGDKLKLEAASPRYAPRFYQRGDVVILGIRLRARAHGQHND